jgi:hypothetical protein
VDSSVFAPRCGIPATVQSAVHGVIAHRIVMDDAAFDPISAIPTREHMKQEER